jgi:hypothetical protein
MSISICNASPKVAKASRVRVIIAIADGFAKNLYQLNEFSKKFKYNPEPGKTADRSLPV